MTMNKNRKADVEGLTTLKPLLWGGFSPDPKKNLTDKDCKGLLAGYVRDLANMTGAHLYPIFVFYPANSIHWLPNLHTHFVILSDRDMPSEIYRKARTKRSGFLMVKRYDTSLGGINYMFNEHYESRYGDIFCWNGKKCKQRGLHDAFHAELHRMFTIWDR